MNRPEVTFGYAPGDLFDAAPDAIVAVDADGVVRLVNRQAEALFGYRREELVGRPVDLLVPDRVRSVHAGHRASYAVDPVPRAMGPGLEAAGRRKDGTEFPVGISLSSLTTNEGVLVLAAVRDITDSKRIGEERGQLEASVLKVERDEERASLEGQLQQAQRLESVGQLAGGVAHDFNNLLAGIMNYAGLVSESLRDEMDRRGLLDDESFATLVEDVGQITHVARRAAALTRQLLIFSRRTVVQPEVLDLNTVVGDMEEMLRRTIGENVDHLETKFAEALPLIKADRGQIDQVVMNLAVNARDAMPGGGRLDIETARFEVDQRYGRLRGIEPGTYVRLTVSDTGTGMSPELVDRAFEPFFTTKAKGEGTGLGLATVYGIVRQAGGDVSIESEPGSGTTVRVDLPATSEQRSQYPLAQPEAGLPEQGETVLLVEDEAIVRDPAQRLLARHGYTVLVASSAAAALAIAADHRGPIHLLLTDVVMPGRSGKELSVDITARSPATKVLFMSGYSYDVIVHQGVLEPGVSLIEKPFSADDLLRKVRLVLDGGFQVSAGVGVDAPPKVLVVDDDTDFRHSTARTLAGHGYLCVEAASGEEARVVLDAEGDVAVVLCDIRMPGESGLELLLDLTADFPELAVVMTTGVDSTETADAAFGVGAFGYVVKPFETNELLNSLGGALRRRDQELAQRRHVVALEQTITRMRALAGLVAALDTDRDVSLQDEEVMERLSRAVSLRDEETGRHIERMSRYGALLAEAVGYEGRSLRALRLAFALHDVGKIGIADGVLLKPGALSGDERTVMRHHARIGYQLLADSRSELLRAAADIALGHHEWWDGGGYPRGLRGEELPEEARIAAVADVFDALTSDRVYRPRMSLDEAIAIMANLRGRQFEPRLLDAFLAAMDEVTAIRNAYPDQDDGPARIRILIVDDHEIFAHSLVRLLDSRPELKIVGTAGTEAEAVVAAVAYAPDVILMDFELPDGDGPHATARIKALTPAVDVIMLTARTDDRSLVQAISAGCAGFVRKEEAVEDLFNAIIAVRDGDTITPPSELAPLLGQLQQTHRGLGAGLTSRELDVLRLMASGLVNKEIAQRLGLRLNTVRNHVQNVSYKMQAHSKLEAVTTAVREGVIDYPRAVGSH